MAPAHLSPDWCTDFYFIILCPACLFWRGLAFFEIMQKYSLIVYNTINSYNEIDEKRMVLRRMLRKYAFIDVMFFK